MLTHFPLLLSAGRESLLATVCFSFSLGFCPQSSPFQIYSCPAVRSNWILSSGWARTEVGDLEVGGSPVLNVDVGPTAVFPITGTSSSALLRGHSAPSRILFPRYFLAGFSRALNQGHHLLPSLGHLRELHQGHCTLATSPSLASALWESLWGILPF